MKIYFQISFGWNVISTSASNVISTSTSNVISTSASNVISTSASNVISTSASEEKSYPLLRSRHEKNDFHHQT